MFRTVVFRLVAIVIGIAAVLLVVEAALQTASRIVQRAGRGAAAAPVEGEFRIACIGESTTFGRWPAQLEEILNRNQKEPRYRVINRGVVGIRTDGVARQIDGWLDEDRPHLVITMLGINDEGNVLVYPRGGSPRWLTAHSRTMRLLALLWRTAFDIGGPDENGDREPSGDGHLDEETRSKLAQLESLRPDAIENFRISEMIEIHRTLITTDPGTPFYHLSFLRGLVLHHLDPDRLDEFFSRQIDVDPSKLDDGQKMDRITIWGERTGDRFAALKLATSIARAAGDTEGEQSLLEEAVNDPDAAGLAWLRMADFGSRVRRPLLIHQSLLKADSALPDDYQWSLLLGDVGFLLEDFDFAADCFERALRIRPDLPVSHELMLLGRLANACEQSGEFALAAGYRAQRDELELGRFREFTRFYYRRVVDRVRARRIPVIAMQYPLLSVESLRKLLDYRDDVTYLENRTNFEAALHGASFRELFEDNFAGAFGHLSPRGNMLLAENVAREVGRMMSELGLGEGAPGDEATAPP
jgi:tetratricopeptide (TPR) repeat protein